MPIKRIKEIIELTVEGSETLIQRQQIFIQHRNDVVQQIAALQKYLEKIDCKINYCSSAYKAYLEGETVSLNDC